MDEKLIQEEVRKVVLDMIRDINNPEIEKYANDVAMGMVAALKTGSEELLAEARAQAMILLETGSIIVTQERKRMIETVLYAVFHVLLKVLSK